MGRSMLQDAIRRTLLISQQAGIRALLTHPIDDETARFYLRFGFVKSPIRDGQLILLLKDARNFFESAAAPGRSAYGPLIRSSH
jgi:hypothetical protein